MLIPTHVPATIESTDTDHRDLITAMRLLSGKDCKRDASQAHLLLVGLSESRRKDVAADAGSLLRAGLARNWFEDVVPHHFDLERIASASIGNYRTDPNKRARMAVVVGLLFLMLGGIAMFVNVSDVDPPWIMISLVGGLVVAGVFFFVATKNRSFNL